MVVTVFNNDIQIKEKLWRCIPKSNKSIIVVQNKSKAIDGFWFKKDFIYRATRVITFTESLITFIACAIYNLFE